MTLSQIYGTVTQECYIDQTGVYKDGERVALDNSHNSGYIRWNGSRTVDRIGLKDSVVTRPFTFVGAVVNGDPDSVLYATISALVAQGATILSATLDKGIIADNELIDLEDLQKFDGVCMISVDYETVKHETYCEAVVVPEPCWIFDTGVWDADCFWTASGIWTA